MRFCLILLSMIMFGAGLARPESHLVVDFLNPVTLRTDEGELLRLAGLAGPELDPFQDRRGVRALTDMAPGLVIDLPEAGAMDRYGRRLVQVWLPDRRWLNGMLVHEGLARVSGLQAVNGEKLRKLLLLEREARLARRGRWGEADGFRIIPAEPFQARTGRFMLVQGRILDVAPRSKFTYLNFGPDWRKDFTIGIPKNRLKNFQRAGLDPEDLKGREILVRGWVEWRNGPFILLENPLLLQLPRGAG